MKNYLKLSLFFFVATFLLFGCGTDSSGGNPNESPRDTFQSDTSATRQTVPHANVNVPTNTQSQNVQVVQSRSVTQPVPTATQKATETPKVQPTTTEITNVAKTVTNSNTKVAPSKISNPVKVAPPAKTPSLIGNSSGAKPTVTVAPKTNSTMGSGSRPTPSATPHSSPAPHSSSSHSFHSSGGHH